MTDSPAGNIDRRFIHNGWNPIVEFWGTYNAGNFVSTYVRHAFWGLDLSGSLSGAGGVGGLLMMQEAGNTYLPAYDAVGNVHAMIKASDGSLAACYEYDAFGQTLRESGPYAASNPFRFAPKYTDIETGLVQYNTRYYSPSLGRFINRDTIGEAGGLNLYAYVGNRVPNSFDMLGMWEVEQHEDGTFTVSENFNTDAGDNWVSYTLGSQAEVDAFLAANSGGGFHEEFDSLPGSTPRGTFNVEAYLEHRAAANAFNFYYGQGIRAAIDFVNAVGAATATALNAAADFENAIHAGGTGELATDRSIPGFRGHATGEANVLAQGTVDPFRDQVTFVAEGVTPTPATGYTGWKHKYVLLAGPHSKGWEYATRAGGDSRREYIVAVAGPYPGTAGARFPDQPHETERIEYVGFVPYGFDAVKRDADTFARKVDSAQFEYGRTQNSNTYVGTYFDHLGVRRRPTDTDVFPGADGRLNIPMTPGSAKPPPPRD